MIRSKLSPFFLNGRYGARWKGDYELAGDNRIIFVENLRPSVKRIWTLKHIGRTWS